MSADSFIGSIKEKRTEALAKYEELLVADFDSGGKPDFHGIARTVVDQVIGGVLDVVEEQYESIVTGTATDSEGEEVSVELFITSNLSTLYSEEVNT